MASFVIEYNRKTGDAKVTEFEGVNAHRRAFKCRLALEGSRASDDIEIVSLNSNSRQTIEKTHARYFQKRLASA